MQLAFDHYTLALSVLDGEPDAHRLLADLLDEQGERGLAQWARKSKGAKLRRLEFVLILLPWRTSLSLGCDFVAHAFGSHNRLNQIISPTLTAVRAWAADADVEFDAATAKTEIRAISANSFRFPYVVEVCTSLLTALGHATQALAAESHDLRIARARTIDTCSEVRRLAQHARKAVETSLQERLQREKGIGWWQHGNDRLVRTAELDWQFEQTHAALAALVAGE
jgi:hypothetical protein